ncbi:hypothetical protein F2Q69_00013503 [Brassica cretica]|uniref:Uncharacterized protein n=1 Tax=Brassica cretica TaxID=69181 RepID=A0A8S9R8Z5_BRACR|nr:hypothetical protein F2Q69_00013503 [Brassica cretica]
MKGYPYRKFSFFRGRGEVLGTGLGELHSGEPGFLLAGTQRPVSCLGSGGIQYLNGKLWAFDGVLETVEPGALMFPEEELVRVCDEKGNGHDEASKFAPLRGVLFVISWTKSKPDFALDSFSIGGRVRSKKHRSGAGPSESLDSSGSSLDLTAEVENPSRAVTGVASPSPRTNRFLLVGPLSSVGVEEVASWRVKYHLPDYVLIRIPSPIDRVSDFEADEVPVYEGFFESGFRDRVPSLVAKVSEALEIFPGQLNPPSLRILIAMQNLGDLEGLTIGVAEVMYSHAITPLNGGEQRYHLHPRGGELPVQEAAKKERKRLPIFDDHWTEKFAFMYLPGFSIVWCTAGGYSECGSFFGKEDDQAGIGAPHRTSSGSFSCEKRSLGALQHLGNMSGSKGEEALAEYKRALKVMSAKKAAPKKPTLSENDDEVQFIKRNKRQATTALASSSKKKSRASGSTPKVSPSSSSDPATVLANLNTKVFPLTSVVLPEGDSSASIHFIQGDLLQAMSQLFHLGERMGDHASLKADLAELTSQLPENVSLREQLEPREEEVCDLRCATETFDAEKTMAVSGAIVVARWEFMREWLNHQTDSWDLEGALERYKMVKTSEAEYRGHPTPSFEGEPAIPSKAATKKTPSEP